VMQWAQAHDCPWDENNCTRAAEGGHLEVLQWAREHGCAWDYETCEDVVGGHLDEMMKGTMLQTTASKNGGRKKVEHSRMSPSSWQSGGHSHI